MRWSDPRLLIRTRDRRGRPRALYHRKQGQQVYRQCIIGSTPVCECAKDRVGQLRQIPTLPCVTETLAGVGQHQSPMSAHAPGRLQFLRGPNDLLFRQRPTTSVPLLMRRTCQYQTGGVTRETTGVTQPEMQLLAFDWVQKMGV